MPTERHAAVRAMVAKQSHGAWTAAFAYGQPPRVFWETFHSEQEARAWVESQAESAGVASDYISYVDRMQEV